MKPSATPDYLYSETELVCRECAEWTHFFDGNDVDERYGVICDECSRGRPLSDYGRKVTRDIGVEQ